MTRVFAGCDACAALHWVREGALGGPCPACGRGTLGAAAADLEVAPELMVPFGTDRDALRARLEDFASGAWLRTAELDGSVLSGRLQPVWWPHWLVDVDVAGLWEAEAGFDYEVESSQEVYDAGRWTTRQVTETRIRWEPRVGRLQRRYDNIDVEGLTEQGRLEALVGAVDRGTAQAFDAAKLGDGAVRLPDRPPAEQWPRALEKLRIAVGRDCGHAAGADHVRDVVLDVDAEQATWSQWLVPGWVTWYADDAGERHLVYVNGVSGRVGGPRLASQARGRWWAGLLFVAAASCGGTGLVIGLVGIVLWPLLAAAAVLLVLALVLGCVGLWPLLYPASHNARELRAPAATTAR